MSFFSYSLDHDVKYLEGDNITVTLAWAYRDIIHVAVNGNDVIDENYLKSELWDTKKLIVTFVKNNILTDSIHTINVDVWCEYFNPDEYVAFGMHMTPNPKTTHMIRSKNGFIKYNVHGEEGERYVRYVAVITVNVNLTRNTLNLMKLRHGGDVLGSFNKAYQCFLNPIFNQQV